MTHTQTADRAKQVNFSTCALFRMIKDAKKEKGTDDFLGTVVIKLQVMKALKFISGILFATFFASLVTPISVISLTGSPLY